MPLDKLSQFLADVRQWGLEYFGKYYGPYRAIVISNKDPSGMGRIKVECPRARIAESGWILPAMSGAGFQSGEFFPPEPNDSVFVFFDNGDPQVPSCYMGGWYAKGEIDPDLAPEGGSPPLKRGVVSPGGHKIIMDDTRNKKNVTIKTPGGHSIVIDDSSGSENITIEHSNGKVIQITSGGKVRIGDKDGKFEPLLKGETVKQWLINHKHPHAWGPTGIPIDPFPPDGLSDDSETS
jgi:uncharacterized protein involved in type VI secretion and phage assembly